MQPAGIQPLDPILEIATGVCGTTRTVTVSGEIDLAMGDRLGDSLREAIAAAPETVLLDLSDVRFVDSTGIRVLVGAHQHALARDVHLVIMRPPATVFRTFQLTGLDAVLPFVAAAA